MRAKKIYEIQKFEQGGNSYSKMKIGQYNITLSNIKKILIDCFGEDINYYENENENSINISDSYFGPDETTLVIEINIDNNNINIEWRAEDTGHANHADYAGDDEDFKSIQEFETYIKTIRSEIDKAYSIWENDEDYDQREGDEYDDDEYDEYDDES